jgi:predicted transcriptional regulator
MRLHEGNTHVFTAAGRQSGYSPWTLAGGNLLSQQVLNVLTVVVTLHRGHAYSSLDAVKVEMAGKAVELIQQGLPHGRQVICIN